LDFKCLNHFLWANLKSAGYTGQRSIEYCGKTVFSPVNHLRLYFYKWLRQTSGFNRLFYFQTRENVYFQRHKSLELKWKNCLVILSRASPSLSLLSVTYYLNGPLPNIQTQTASTQMLAVTLSSAKSCSWNVGEIDARAQFQQYTYSQLLSFYSCKCSGAQLIFQQQYYPNFTNTLN